MIYFDTLSTIPLLKLNQVQTAVARLPVELGHRVMQSADPEEQARRAGGYALLERMVNRYVSQFKSVVEGIVKPEFGAFFDSRMALSAVRYDSYGKPFFEGHENLTFSLAHSRHLVACALHIAEEGKTAEPVGIDVEFFSNDRAKAERVAERYFSAEEKAILARESTDNVAFCRTFIRIWTRKEALLKYWGVGLSKISQADTAVPAQHHCVFTEKEEIVTITDLYGKETTESYTVTLCSPENSPIQL